MQQETIAWFFKKHQIVVQDDADVKQLSAENKLSLLEDAVSGGPIEVVDLLLDGGVDVSKQPRFLSKACLAIDDRCQKSKNHQHEIIKKLLQAGANVNAVDNNSRTPLNLAVMGCAVEIVKTLLNAGAIVNLHENTLEFAIDTKFWAYPLVVELCKDSHIAYKNDAFKYSVKKQNMEVMNFFQDQCDINGCDSNGETALHIAARSGNPFLIDYLCIRGADIGVCDHKGNVPLHYARNAEVVAGLLARGSGVNVPNLSGESPLHKMAHDLQVMAIRYLIKYGAIVDLTNKKRQTPLHYVALHDNSDYDAGVCIGVLVENGANINAQDKNGKTPLHYAAALGATGIVRTLLQCGAKVELKDHKGRTALYLAASTIVRDTTEVINILIKEAYARITPADFDKLHAIDVSFKEERLDLLSKVVDASDLLAPQVAAMQFSAPMSAEAAKSAESVARASLGL